MLFRREVGHVKTYLRNQILYNLGAKTGNLPEKFKDILVLGQQSLYTFGQIINQSLSLVYILSDHLKKINVMLFNKTGTRLKQFFTRECGACTVGVPAKDTIKIVDTDHYGVETPERKFVYQIQTPQTFQVPLLRRAYETMYEAKRNGDTHNITDDTMLVEQYAGVRCKVVEGAYENIKITTPEDLAIAEIFVEKTLKKI